MLTTGRRSHALKRLVSSSDRRRRRRRSEQEVVHIASLLLRGLSHHVHGEREHERGNQSISVWIRLS